jgi:ElaB/YqjD/DUF883 family membrane-anchored ribosome-binding protein
MPSAADRDLADMAELPDDGALPLASETARAAAETAGAYESEAIGERTAVAGSLRRSAERIATRIRSGDANGARGEIESVIREWPLATVVAGAVLGFGLGRLLRR